MRSQLYLWEPLRQQYISDLATIKDMFIERIQPILQIQNQKLRNTKMNCGKAL